MLYSQTQPTVDTSSRRNRITADEVTVAIEAHWTDCRSSTTNATEGTIHVIFCNGYEQRSYCGSSPPSQLPMEYELFYQL